jgi:hypothetical protein
MKYLIVALILVMCSTAFAKVELMGSKKAPRNCEDVVITMQDNGQFKGCEEMGIIHSRNATIYQTKNGMFKRMRKQAGAVGATHILVKTSDLGQMIGSVFYCSSESSAQVTNRDEATK